MSFTSKKTVGITLAVIVGLVALLLWSGAFRKLTGPSGIKLGNQSADETKNTAAEADTRVPSGPEPTYFAEVVDGIVTQVIVADPEFIATIRDDSEGEWLQTWYNVSGGAHYDPNTGQSDDKEARRENTAGIGYSYDKDLDAFIPPRPFESWKLNRETALWEAPVAKPDDGKAYSWNDKTGAWEELTLPAMPTAPVPSGDAPDTPSEVAPQ